MTTNTRATILESAARIVAAAGAAHLTIDAVAAKAAMSKGGVLYHFPTKQALLEGMLERLLEQMAERAAANRAAHADEPNAALIARMIEEHDQRPAERAMTWAILAAAAEDPESLAPARLAAQQAFDEAAQGSNPPVMGWVLLLATEGLRVLEMLKLLPLSRNERAEVHAHLLRLAKEHAA
ncbi:MAG: TetR/AcrR family transcriptional regulator [Gammaproteobacteria bacterium]|nr:TetR/AcrR family transcriptional regulator [Gammaproteobacteria bacterium]